ncbi:hemolysin family protein [Sporohalobacter salinus]|uniref:hemolysin family protein n=1 Tax=Sporohalobacter salinus TaxID=1494606 RepID=UPI0019621BA8|nr:hemolysin family protein [Sporohalobacter salinus]MBM7623160.1 gliding motility-associated protein GldE [Sporohalobacter salinus]
MGNLTSILELVVLGSLFILSGFFSGSETALMSVNRVKVRHLAQEGDSKAELVDNLLGQPNKLLTTILVGNNLVNVAASSIATALAIEVFGAKGVGIATGGVTLFILVFGEITPKSFATQNSELASKWVAGYIQIFSYIFFPFIKVLTFVTNFIIKALGGQPQKNEPFVTEEEIKKFVTVGEKEGVIESDEKEMINSIFDFDDTLVKEIMVPRIDMVCVDIETSVDDLVEIIIDWGYSRIPVYNDTVDNIVGILYAKDLLTFLNNEGPSELRKIMRPAYYVPETKEVDTLLTELRKERIHMAIVLDEYGGTAGLITIEDLLEEIVGDIQDEYDEEENLIEVISKNEILVDAKVDIDEVNEIMDIYLPEEDYETVGGFILSTLGYVPEAGEEIEFNNLKLIIEETIQRRISEVRIKNEEDKEEEELEPQNNDG